MMPEIPARYIKHCSVVKLQRGICFMHVCEEAKYVYLIRQGKVNVSNTREDGRECQLAPVSEGGVLGEMEAIRGDKEYMYSATTLQDCILIRMAAPAFITWLQEEPEACWYMTRVLAEKLYTSSSQTVVQNKYDAVHRLMRQLLLMGEGKVMLTHKQLADTCSMSIRTMQRCVERLKDEGLININRGKIELSKVQLEKMKEQINLV